jgi:hypothetical protein
VQHPVRDLPENDPAFDRIDPTEFFDPGQVVQLGPQRFKSDAQENRQKLVPDCVLQTAGLRDEPIQSFSRKALFVQVSDPVRVGIDGFQPVAVA